VKGFLKIKLSLEADEQIARDAEAELDAQGEVGAHSFLLADQIAELSFADLHGLCVRPMLDCIRERPMLVLRLSSIVLCWKNVKMQLLTPSKKMQLLTPSN
jgi:hypothetical protein